MQARVCVKCYYGIMATRSFDIVMLIILIFFHKTANIVERLVLLINYTAMNFRNIYCKYMLFFIL